MRRGIWGKFWSRTWDFPSPHRGCNRHHYSMFRLGNPLESWLGRRKVYPTDIFVTREAHVWYIYLNLPSNNAMGYEISWFLLLSDLRSLIERSTHPAWNLKKAWCYGKSSTGCFTGGGMLGWVRWNKLADIDGWFWTISHQKESDESKKGWCSTA